MVESYNLNIAQIYHSVASNKILLIEIVKDPVNRTQEYIFNYTMYLHKRVSLENLLAKKIILVVEGTYIVRTNEADS